MNMQSIYTRTSTVSSTHGCSVLPSHQGNRRSLLNETETGRSDVFPSCAKKQDHLLRQFPLNSLKKQPQLQEQEEANLHIYIYIYLYCDSFQLCCVELLSGQLCFSYHAPLVVLLECFTSERCTCFYINLKLTISSSEKSGWLSTNYTFSEKSQFFLSVKVKQKILSYTRWRITILNPKMEVWKMMFLFNWVIFRFHVDFQGYKIQRVYEI